MSLIDDEEMVLDSIYMLLGAEGFQIQTAMNGDEAFKLINKDYRPDIIVSDYLLPGLKGHEVVKRLRERMNSEIPAVILTGDTSAIEIANAEIGNCNILHKPADTNKLISVISEMTA